MRELMLGLHGGLGDTAGCAVLNCSNHAQRFCDPIACSLPGSCPWNSPSKNTGVGCLAGCYQLPIAA